MGLRARAVNGLHAPPSVSNVELCLQMFDMGFLFLWPNKVYIHTCIVFIKLLNSLVWCLSNVSLQIFKTCGSEPGRASFGFVFDVELQRNNSIQKRPAVQSMEKFQRNTVRIQPMQNRFRSSHDPFQMHWGGQGRTLDVGR